ncbi:Uncharacterised protein [Acholeplasma oculi]|uniref:Uncharacterized protein n=1 Tax=Acholeplasma oculi TaxID=35623 RepID=A0A061AAL4_9MOLU|nr:hypothetical protein [Acholeplasma oculi]CDR30878.1 hypothetical protein Aocu_08050 [Acholeplasma oculi]SKC35382.1 hypothetical protein SAMN02745122_0230 [Acholeplasma oculi]SUT90012.1 Uncharacterised protein [Acholeplasma oculi]
MRRLVGLVGLIVSGVVFASLFLGSFQQYLDAWNSSTDLWEQAQAVVAIIWNTVYQPLVLLILSLIALEGK